MFAFYFRSLAVTSLRLDAVAIAADSCFLLVAWLRLTWIATFWVFSAPLA
jgi:hypothetical protein